MPPSELDQAIEAIQSGQKAQGLVILARLVSQEPRNERAWLWLASCVDEPERRRYCLQRALDINPASEAGRQLLAELDAPATPPPQPPVSEATSAPAQAVEMALALSLVEQETPKPPSRFGEWGVILTTGLYAGLVGVILAAPLQFFGLFADTKKTTLWIAYSVLWVGVGLIAAYLLRLRGISNKISRAVVGAPAGFITGLALGLVTAFTLSITLKNSPVIDASDSVVSTFISSALIYGAPLALIGMAVAVMGALAMVGIIGAIEWVKEPTEDGGRKTNAK